MFGLINLYKTYRIKRIMHELNETCFKDRLKLDGVKIIIGPDENNTGFIGELTYHKETLTPVYIKMHEAVEWLKDISLLKAILAHELIHVYELQILKKKPAHREEFRQQMFRINNMKLGFKVERIWRHKVKHLAKNYRYESDIPKTIAA